MARTPHNSEEEMHRLHEASADALLQRYEEKVTTYRELYRAKMADAFESILEVEIARRLDDEQLIDESKRQAIANLEEADLAKEKYEDYERRLTALEALLDEDDGLDHAFERYVHPDDEQSGDE